MLRDVDGGEDIEQPHFCGEDPFFQQKIQPADKARGKEQRKNVDPRAVLKNQHRTSSQFQHNYTTKRGEKQRNATENQKLRL